MRSSFISTTQRLMPGLPEPDLVIRVAGKHVVMGDHTRVNQAKPQRHLCRPRLRSQKSSGCDSLGLEELDLEPNGRFDLGKGQSVVVR